MMGAVSAIRSALDDSPDGMNEHERKIVANVRARLHRSARGHGGYRNRLRQSCAIITPPGSGTSIHRRRANRTSAAAPMRGAQKFGHRPHKKDPPWKITNPVPRPPIAASRC